MAPRNRLPIRMGQQLFERFRSAVESTPGYTRKDYSRWVSEAVVELADNDEKVLAHLPLEVGDQLETDTVPTEVALSDDALEKLSTMLTVLRRRRPEVEWSRALIIRAAIRRQLKEQNGTQVREGEKQRN